MSTELKNFLIPTLVILTAIIMVALLVGSSGRRNRRQDQRTERERKAEEKRVSHALDEQKNLGNQAKNLIAAHLKDHTHLEFQAWIYPENGGSFSIHVVRWHDGAHTSKNDVLQLSFNCVNPQGGKNNAHVHYGVHGADTDFAVRNDNLKFMLKDLVFVHLDLAIEREQANYEKRITSASNAI